MISRRTLLASAAALPLAAPFAARAAAPMPVVATFSILGDMVARVGGAHVALTTLVGPDGDTHVYSPTPADARAVSGAKMLFVNGLEFEGWLDRLVEAAEFSGERVVATSEIDPMPFEEGHEDEHGHDDHDGHHEHGHDEDHDHEEHAHEEGHDDHGDDHEEHAHGDHEDDHEEHAHDDHDHDDDHAHADAHGHHHGVWDPHGWQSLANAVSYVNVIAAALAKADPAHAAEYEAARAAYVSEIEALDAEIHAMLDPLPEDRRVIVTSHDAFQYFGRDYGLTFLAPQGLSTESEPSAKDVAALIRRIREDGVSALFVENISDPRLLQRIADETGVAIGGTLYPGALSGPEGPAPTYLAMMRHNAMQIASALGV